MSNIMIINKEDYEKLLHQRDELLSIVEEKSKITAELFDICNKKDATLDEYHGLVEGYRKMFDALNVPSKAIWAHFIANVAWGNFAEQFRTSKNYNRIKLREKTQYLITYDRILLGDKRK